MLKSKKVLFIGMSVLINFLFSWSAQAQPWLANNNGLPGGKISEIVRGVVTWALGIFGFLGIIAFLISGILYLTAAGNAEQEKTAKNAMKMGIIGIVVGLLGFVIIKAVDTMLNARGDF